MSKIYLFRIWLGLGISLLVATASSCKTKISQENIKPVSEQEIYEVINAVVKLGRFDTINFNKDRPLRIIDTLENTKVYFEKPMRKANGKVEMSAPHPTENVGYLYLISQALGKFTRIDSAFLGYQNAHTKKMLLDSTKFKIISTISRKKYDSSWDKGTIYSLLTLSIPVFSLDHNSAYIRSGFRCGFLCGYGEELFLVKVNGKWLIKLRRNTWIS